MEQQRFEHIREQAKLMAKRQNACTEGFRKLVASTNLGELRAVLHEYWSDILAMLRKDNFMLLRDYYLSYKTEFNAIGLWFNESTDQGKAILTEGSFEVFGNARAWAYENASVDLNDTARCSAFGKVFVCARGNSVLSLSDKASCYAYERSNINANGHSEVDAFESCTITAGEDASVYAHGWNVIKAVGNAQIFAPSSRKIKLLGNAKLTLKKPEDL